ncbi:hypothetical protein KEH57_26010 [Burkholderia cenocepacia]|uniref:hypothetical protein n=1 Tax=Burkholderia cenocepacia TaxID=95486 RepID=UPI001BABD30E|nr:hypothetical protein [Burkholderia cenocepacia]QUO30648.1 hypothetical protein KEH57_26010 [Burkholderia cenocepacia]
MRSIAREMMRQSALYFRIFKDIIGGNLHERFGIGAGDLHTYFEDTLLNPDFHRWPTLVGDRILKSGTSVWETMVTEWCRICLTDDVRDGIVSAIQQTLPVGV